MRKTAKRNPGQQKPFAATQPGTTLRRASPFLTVFVVLLVWQWVSAREIISHILVPPPVDVFRAFAEAIADGTLPKHALVTLEEMLYGLIIGVGIGLIIGYAIAKAPLLENILSPVIVGFQSTPIVAYAPLLVIWFGSGLASKVVTTAVIVFFPMLVNTIVGIRSVSPNMRDLLRSLKAGRWQTFRHLEVPSALPVVLAGLKTSTTLAVIGAVVGEFVSQGSGLGFLVTSARNLYDTPLVVVAVLTMTAISLSLYGLVAYVEWRFLFWQRRSSL